MPLKGGSGPPVYIPSAYGTANRKDYAGDGSYQNPFQFLYHSGDAGINYNATTLSCSLLMDQTNVGIRIKRIIVTLTGSAAAALNTMVRIAININTKSGAAGATSTYIGGDTMFTGPHSTAGYYDDTHIWEYGPDGIVLLHGDASAFDGNWDGMVYPMFSGYAATDDAVVIIEGEWWYL